MGDEVTRDERSEKEGEKVSSILSKYCLLSQK